MTIQWFPGHMTRARRQIQDKLKLIDLAIELMDARIPISSRNPMIDEILGSKPRLILLNKADLADPAMTSEWVHRLKKDGVDALPIDSISGTNVKEIIPHCKQLLAEKREAQIRKGMKPRPIRALIVGIPNVGKSTLINRLAGRKAAITGDRPGVTKGQQWIRIGGELELLDTPGILWPKFEDQEVGARLAAIGSIRDEILHPEDIAFYVIRYMIQHYPEALSDRYELEGLPKEVSEPEPVIEVMEMIGRRRGCLQSGGKVNLEKASALFLKDLRAGKMGRISLEHPGD
ncbi:ribosome biogenesis GTPase YlqF [Paenibacillus sp. J2TS4]|uniref:ribosome biogenesis GTPase YlqF n=1 Tax=Paenibacillus sp. J2TS4 TaxID=2807194 RepID=UPI001B268CC1|nr:ribosome biogenesis GTPase YlqF [Paenibacillus sp. J2TS4]GIP33031.1 ribosome biogenesis GTPase A [Paenibacillus sp. J2TS4]